MKTTLIVIQNDADHAQAKALIEKLMNSKDPADQARMVAQAYLTEAYERSRWPRRAPSLPDLLAYLMDQHGLTRAELIPLLGTASRVSEVLTGKRDLSMTMVRKLRERFHIPADLLIPPFRSIRHASRRISAATSDMSSSS
jgi:HTH-type transcriptional regulator / antitoxin HigA